jgi:hypothetical protein
VVVGSLGVHHAGLRLLLLLLLGVPAAASRAAVERKVLHGDVLGLKKRRNKLV